MALQIHNVEQGTPEWHALRAGIPTASEFSKLLTSTYKIADNKGSRDYAIQKAGEILTGRVEETYLGWDMQRGKLEEERAFDMYCANFAQVEKCGFMTNYGIGYSPDGLVGTDGLIEIKSANQRIQVERIVFGGGADQHMIQIQVGLFVSGRKWCDFVSFSNGMPLHVERVLPDAKIHKAILEAKGSFDSVVNSIIDTYKQKTKGLPIAEYIEKLQFEDEILIN
jgi:hypothetical protein